MIEPTIFEYDKLLKWSKMRDFVVCNDSGNQILIQSLVSSVGLAERYKKDKNKFENKPNQEYSFQETNDLDKKKLPVNFKQNKYNLINSLEDQLVKKWKFRSIIWVLFVTLFSVFAIYIYTLEIEIFMSKEKWNAIKNGTVGVLLKLCLSILWGSFSIKIIYDRYFDISKEENYRNSLNRKFK